MEARTLKVLMVYLQILMELYGVENNLAVG